MWDLEIRVVIDGISPYTGPRSGSALVHANAVIGGHALQELPPAPGPRDLNVNACGLAEPEFRRRCVRTEVAFASSHGSPDVKVLPIADSELRPYGIAITSLCWVSNQLDA
ncbi:MAG: hypothetical protein WBH85_10035 [Thermoanaerobaculia bacterium]